MFSKAQFFSTVGLIHTFLSPPQNMQIWRLLWMPVDHLKILFSEESCSNSFKGRGVALNIYTTRLIADHGTAPQVTMTD